MSTTLDEKKDVKVTSIYSTDIWRIEAQYTRNKADKRRAAPVDTSSNVDIDMIPPKAVGHSPTTRTLVHSSSTPSDTPGTFTAPLPPRFVIRTSASWPLSLRLCYIR